ncbi:MAG: DUF4981 domain-containing protein [Butyrivibrio sp.]|nr:DUF4981 domain-containing protein [Butyrivibrio sp.]
MSKENGNGFDYAILADPTRFKERVMPARTDAVAYGSREEMSISLEPGRAADAMGWGLEGNTLRESLAGLWSFRYAPNLALAPMDFCDPETDIRDWEVIRVPAHIQLEGYDTPAYVNVQYPWDGMDDIRIGEIPEHRNPVGSYVRQFTVPERMKGLPVHVVFAGVESGYALWCNGTYVGYSEDSFTPSAFDLTPYLKEGENRLAVQVVKWTSSSWMEDQDFFRFSGIFRGVWLEAQPVSSIADVAVEALPAEDLQTAMFSCSVTLADQGGHYESAVLPAQLPVDGVAIPPREGEALEGYTLHYTLKYRENEVLAGELPARPYLHFQELVEEPQLWSAENPQLYTLTLWVTASDGREVCALQEVVGFRRFEMVDGIMRLNGARIVFNGVNRHEFSCDRGRVPCYEEVEADILNMKRHNINAIRTSHYQNAPFIYRLADRYGLYMIAENNLETHGSWEPILRGIYPIEAAIPGDRDDCRAMMMYRVDSTFQLGKNHPAILIWSIGNEAFGGQIPLEMSERFHALDRHRLVHYEGLFNDRRKPDTSDMESQMYPKVWDIEHFLAEHPDKPFICCEYTHAMANSCGGMFKYTDLTKREPRYQGGFIWDYVDQALRGHDRYGREILKYGGDSGERPTDYSFSGNGIVNAERQPYAKLQEVKYNYQPIDVVFPEGTDALRVINYALFTPTSAYECVVTLLRDGAVVDRAGLDTDVAPLSEGTCQIPAALLDKMLDVEAASGTERPEARGEYVVTVSFRLKENTVWAKAGHEVAWGQTVRRVSVRRVPTTHGSLRVVRGNYNLGVYGEGFSVQFSYGKGGLASYRYGGKEFIDTIPRPNFWRAPTENDRGNRMGARYGIWKILSLYQDSRPFLDESKEPKEAWAEMAEMMKGYPEITEEVDGVSIKSPVFLPVPGQGNRVRLELSYHVRSDGRVCAAMDYEPVQGVTLPPMPEFGFLFGIPADYDRVEYYGKGTMENYSDRNRGARLGIWKTTARDAMEPYLFPEETGNRTGVRWARITDRTGRGLLFEAGGEEMDFSAIPYTPDELESAQHPQELPPIQRTVVRTSLRQMGVGGDDSWGAPVHDEFLLPVDQHLHFEVSFRGVV